MFRCFVVSLFPFYSLKWSPTQKRLKFLPSCKPATQTSTPWAMLSALRILSFQSIRLGFLLAVSKQKKREMKESLTLLSLSSCPLCPHRIFVNCSVFQVLRIVKQESLRTISSLLLLQPPIVDLWELQSSASSICKRGVIETV